MGGTLILFDTSLGSGHFFCLNFLITSFLGGFRNVYIFGGMKILCGYFFFGGGGHDKIGLVLGVSSMYFRVFSYGKCTE